jgi:hypothetical protein
VVVDASREVDVVLGDAQALEVEVADARHPADHGLHPADPAAGAVDDPLEDAHVLAEARPQELAVRPGGTS